MSTCLHARTCCSYLGFKLKRTRLALSAEELERHIRIGRCSCLATGRHLDEPPVYNHARACVHSCMHACTRAPHTQLAGLEARQQRGRRRARPRHPPTSKRNPLHPPPAHPPACPFVHSSVPANECACVPAVVAATSVAAAMLVVVRSAMLHQSATARSTCTHMCAHTPCSTDPCKTNTTQKGQHQLRPAQPKLDTTEPQHYTGQHQPNAYPSFQSIFLRLSAVAVSEG